MRQSFLQIRCNAGRSELSRRTSSSNVGTAVEEAFVLTPQNVQALRTLFNIAHRLDHRLGKSWFMVLDNLNNLDRILHSPRTTTQVCFRLPVKLAVFEIGLTAVALV